MNTEKKQNAKSVNKLQPLEIHKLKNNDLLGFCDSTHSIITPHKDKMNNIFNAIYEKFNQNKEAFRITINNPKSSVLSKPISVLDKNRTAYIGEILRTISYHKKGISTNKNAALALERVLKPFGNLRKLTIDAKTAVVRSMIKDLNTTKDCDKILKDLNLLNIFETLKSINEELDEVINELQDMKKKIEKANYNSDSDYSFNDDDVEALKYYVKHLKE
jgi:hypothetical protein